MIPLELMLEVRRLLDQGRLSQRQIADRLGVSRGSVYRLASGRWEPAEREMPAQPPRIPPVQRTAIRCPTCGGMVYAPCRLCATRVQRRYQLRRAGGVAARAIRILRAA